MSDPADQIIAHYERHASSWDNDRRAAGWNDKCWIDRFIGLLPTSATVLDLGCGGGLPVAVSMVERLLSTIGFEVMEHSINDPKKGGRIVWIARETFGGAGVQLR